MSETEITARAPQILLDILAKHGDRVQRVSVEMRSGDRVIRHSIELRPSKPEVAA